MAAWRRRRGLFQCNEALFAATTIACSPSPFEWGRHEGIRARLENAFDLKFETGTTTLRVPSGQAARDLFIAGFGPTKTVAASLEPRRREEFTRDFIEYHDRFRGDLGVAQPREYLVPIGVRR